MSEALILSGVSSGFNSLINHPFEERRSPTGGGDPKRRQAALNSSRASFRSGWIIDRLPHRINQSRAAIIHARTSELLERLGVIDAF
jgi:hypothetical protein